MRSLAVLLLVPVLALTGCALTSTATPAAESGLAIQGRVHGGQQPISGAHVYLFAANTTGYGGNGIAASSSNASISLLKSSSTGLSDSVGAYVTTATDGSFTITGDYTCTSGQQVYLYALGGNTGSGTNTASGLMAILGNCPSAGNFTTSTASNYVPFVSINEVTTIAAAYAFAGFATDATHVSSSGTALAQTGIANAFANAANLASVSLGTALATTPAGNGTVPQSEINTLANILSYCVNSTNTGNAISSNCSTLFSDALSAGTTGSTPTDTATAAIYIAQNPGANVSNLFTLVPASPPFAAPGYTQPNDFAIAVKFTTTTLSNPYGIAIDAAGNAWVANNRLYSGTLVGQVIELSSNGAPPSTNLNGFFVGYNTKPYSVAIDQSGDIWVNYIAYSASSPTASVLVEYSSAGSTLTNGTSATFGFVTPANIAIDSYGKAWLGNYSNGFSSGAMGGAAADGSGNVWFTSPLTNTVTELSHSGSNIFQTSVGYSTSMTGGIAFDSSGNAWVGLESPSAALLEISHSGTVLSGSSGFGGFGSINSTTAVDGAGNVWVTGATTHTTSGSVVSKYSNAGINLSGANGGYLAGSFNQLQGLAIDGSGNVWTTTANSVAELIGAAAPVITPICAGLPATPTADGSSNLGTRP